MLVIPLHRRITLRHFPALTLMIVLLNAIVFFIFQTDDDLRAQRTAAYYLSSGLADIEYPRYLTFRVDTQDDNTQLMIILAESEPTVKMILVESDREFQKLLSDERIITPDEAIFQQWKGLRRDFENIRDAGFTNRYLLRYRAPAWYQWFTHMFLHGNFGHLLGNMVFLGLLGLLVEPAVKPGVFFSAYLICGLAAACASFAIHNNEVQGMLGASGAIAGLMGLYTVLFGRRRVKFFYWVFVYFDYIKAPALLLLPVWLGWEVLQFLLVDSNVAYEAHAAGIGTGALLGFVLTRLRRVDIEYLDLETVQASRQTQLDIAKKQLKAVQFEQAKHTIRELLTAAPDDIVARQLHFRACRNQPNDDEFHAAAKWLLSLPTHQPATLNLVLETYRSYRQATAGRLRLPASLLLSLTIRHATSDLPQEALTLFKSLSQRAPHTGGLEQARDAIVNAFRRCGQDKHANAVPELPKRGP